MGQYKGEEEESDYGYYEAEGDSDEKGWKVRRATMYYVTVLLKKDKNFTSRLNTEPGLINCLTEKLI